LLCEPFFDPKFLFPICVLLQIGIPHWNDLSSDLSFEALAKEEALTKEEMEMGIKLGQSFLV